MIPLNVTKQKILKEIKNNPNHGYKLAKELNLQTSTIYKHLNDLEKAGFVEGKEMEDKVIYQLTEKGQLLSKALFEEI